MTSFITADFRVPKTLWNIRKTFKLMPTKNLRKKRFDLLVPEHQKRSCQRVAREDLVKCMTPRNSTSTCKVSPGADRYKRGDILGPCSFGRKQMGEKALLIGGYISPHFITIGSGPPGGKAKHFVHPIDSLHH